MKKLLFLLLVSVCFISVVHAQQAASQDSTTTLKQYVGKYTFPDGSVVTEVDVTLDNGALSIASSAGVSSLEKQGEDLYVITVYQGMAKFNRDANKKVIGISINAMGYQLEGTKADAASSAVAWQPAFPDNKWFLFARTR